MGKHLWIAVTALLIAGCVTMQGVPGVKELSQQMDRQTALEIIRNSVAYSTKDRGIVRIEFLSKVFEPEQSFTSSVVDDGIIVPMKYGSTTPVIPVNFKFKDVNAVLLANKNGSILIYYKDVVVADKVTEKFVNVNLWVPKDDVVKVLAAIYVLCPVARG
jgi:hypothetical protein